MKFPFFKAVLLSAAILTAWNCSEDIATSLPTPDVPSTDIPTVPVFPTPEIPVSSSAAVVPTPTPTPTPTPASSSSVVPPKSSSSSSKPQSSSSQPAQSQDGQCFDKPSGKYVKPWENLNANGMSYGYNDNCGVECWYDPANSNCASLGSATSSGNNNNNNNNNQQPQSSSSKPQSSSSSSRPQSSSSSVVSNTGSGSSPNIKVVSNGKSGSGWGTRYWDSCKPHCAWEGKGGPVATTCNASGQKMSADAKSACEGGPAGTCSSQVPWAVNNEYAYAFAAAPGNEGGCGQCFMFTFDGKGKYSTNGNHQAIKGKKLIVMISNVGYDVAQGQFDIMIPGGGVGAFSGCRQMGISCAGAQYGGLLTDCENELGYNASAAKYKECLANKCKKEYQGDYQKGCLFLAEWMEAANNPTFTYQQVECPSELAAKY